MCCAAGGPTGRRRWWCWSRRGDVSGKEAGAWGEPRLVGFVVVAKVLGGTVQVFIRGKGGGGGGGGFGGSGCSKIGVNCGFSPPSTSPRSHTTTLLKHQHVLTTSPQFILRGVQPFSQSFSSCGETSHTDTDSRARNWCGWRDVTTAQVWLQMCGDRCGINVSRLGA